MQAIATHQPCWLRGQCSITLVLVLVLADEVAHHMKPCSTADIVLCPALQVPGPKGVAVEQPGGEVAYGAPSAGNRRPPQTSTAV